MPEPPTIPGFNADRFTNRVADIQHFETQIARPGNELTPLWFHGVGGAGKTTLLQRFKQTCDAEGIPCKIVDVCPHGQGALQPLEVYAAIRTGLLPDQPAPRFDLATEWLRVVDAKTADRERRASDTAASLGGTTAQGLEEVFDLIPAGVPVAKLTKKALGPAADWLGARKLWDYFKTDRGLSDFQHLKALAYQHTERIYAELPQRLVDDLHTLPRRPNAACRAVVMFDHAEAFATPQDRFRHGDQDAFLRALTTAALSATGRFYPVFVSHYPCDWAKRFPDQPTLNQPDQRPVAGFDRSDALTLLGKWELQLDNHPELIEAVLAACAEDRPDDAPAHYFVQMLELCATAIDNERDLQGQVTSTAASFRLPAGDWKALTRRLLKSVRDDTERDWLLTLAATPRFDEPAARAMHGGGYAAEDAAWRRLRRYPFLNTVPPYEHWFTFHQSLTRGLRRELAEDPAHHETLHRRWLDHWTARQGGPS
ncbi:MAG: hypothetical protein AAF750_01500 [Planctomycetota bacterium]